MSARIKRVIVPLVGSDLEKLEALVEVEERLAREALAPHETGRPIDEHGHLVGQAETLRRIIRRAFDEVDDGGGQE